MRISSTVDIFKLGVGNYNVQKTEVKKKTYEMPSNTTYIIVNEFVICGTLLNVGIVEQIAEAGQKVHSSN